MAADPVLQAAVYVPLLVPAVAGLTARPLTGRLPPAAVAWLLTVSALALALASGAVLGVLALSAVVRIGFVDASWQLSAAVISRGDLVSVPVAVIAAGLLGLAAAAAGLALWRRLAAIAAAHRRAAALPGTSPVVVTEDAAADAYTLPGWPCRVVITQGMLRVLAGRERDVLLAHERAHAQHSHYLFTSAARLAAAANPLLRPLAAEVGYAVERWADERAAAETGDRALTARAIARAALASGASPAASPAAGTPPGQPSRRSALAESGIARAPGQVPRRVAALLAPPQALSARGLPLLLVAAVVALVALSGAAALTTAVDLHNLIELAQLPPG
jgi:Zn-dependent protease with chaperone function